MPSYKSLAAQRHISTYAEQWGTKIITAPDRFFNRWRDSERLARVGIYNAGFSAKHTDGQSSAVDTVRGYIYWPALAVEPYLLLHELTHLMMTVLFDTPPTAHNEGGFMAAVEAYSVAYLARRSKYVTLSSWLYWRTATSEYERKAELLADLEDFRDVVLDSYLFYENKDGLLEPSFWHLFPDRPVQG